MPGHTAFVAARRNGNCRISWVLVTVASRRTPRLRSEICRGSFGKKSGGPRHVGRAPRVRSRHPQQQNCCGARYNSTERGATGGEATECDATKRDLAKKLLSHQTTS